MSLERPALGPADVVSRTGSFYPEHFRARVLPRERAHHHTHEDELVFILEGEVVMRADRGEQVLTAGMCAGFAAGSGDGHQLVNRSDLPARYLEISNRDPNDTAAYPDDDLAYSKGPDGRGVFTRKDRTSY